MDDKKFTFWKENKSDKEYCLALSEIKKAYIKFLLTKDKTWCIYYGAQTVNSFVGEKDGLNSVMDLHKYSELQEDLKETRNQFCNDTSQTIISLFNDLIEKLEKRN